MAARETRNGLTDVASEKLAALLPGASREDVARFDAADLDALAGVLTRWHADRYDADVATHILRLLSFTAYVPATTTIQRLIEGKGAFASVPTEVVDAARESLASIRTNIELSRQQQTLLRAASPVDADPSTLLRPATHGGEPAEQLLRPAGEEPR